MKKKILALSIAAMLGGLGFVGSSGPGFMIPMNQPYSIYVPWTKNKEKTQ